MFHRVKSEGQDASVEKDEAPITGNESTKNSAPQAAKTAEPEQTPPKETTTQTKDSNEMSDKTENKPPEDDKQAEAANAPAATNFAYQRAPAAPASAAPSAYPGNANSSYGSNYAAQGNRESSAAASSKSDRRLTIGAGITMSGEIESCDYLLVEGTVEAALKGANVLDIAESGTFYGTVEIDEANIAGRFEGDITVHGRLTISESGTVTGSIAYKELEIEAGAIIDGKLTPLSAAQSSSDSSKKSAAALKSKATTPAKTKPAESKPQEAANNEGGLFSKAAAE